MAVKFDHSSEHDLYFCTFTCYKWISLFELTNSYDCVYKWFNYLRDEKSIEVVAFVIMPNHIHVILYFPVIEYNLNLLIGNAKRFMIYEIVQRLKEGRQEDVLKILENGVTDRDRKKGQIHKGFENSFDAKPILTEEFFFQKLEYIHYNPVRGKWALAENYTDYVHSSAAFYEFGKAHYFEPKHYNEL